VELRASEGRLTCRPTTRAPKVGESRVSRSAVEFRGSQGIASRAQHRGHSIEGIASRALHRGYCIDGIASRALHRGHCIEGIASRVLYRRHCIDGIALTAFRVSEGRPTTSRGAWWCLEEAREETQIHFPFPSLIL
jgi:hypothetical protein